MRKMELWERYKKYTCYSPEIGLILDISRMNFPEDYFMKMEPFIEKAYRDMKGLEGGAIANPGEMRMAGHYWLRNPDLAPDLPMKNIIEATIRTIKQFTAEIHCGVVAPQKAERFRRFLVIGIGGSALGPQFVADALGNTHDPMKPYFFDNTDPDGMDRVLSDLGGSLSETLVLVISKSGGTKETRNGMLEARRAYERIGLEFSRHAVAVTGVGSELDRAALEQGWIKRFPMWDWVGGRTSVTSAVGLLPASLQGFDIDSFLSGARTCDELTRKGRTLENPSALLALMWYYATGGRGNRHMVILPYKDRLLLFSRYLQQLVMESLGKKFDLAGSEVKQGISVYGNKGSTDQHAYVQQLRDGLNNFFVTFIEVLKDRKGKSAFVEDRTTSGDFLNGFLHGTRDALHGNARESMTLTMERIDAFTLGALIALYERAVGFYASLININAYDQPGVEAGKKAAAAIINLQNEILRFLHSRKGGKPLQVEEIAAGIGHLDEVELVFKILLHASSNEDHGITMYKSGRIFESRFE
ncbi:MAG: glucose-6-phosphate isomerase [Geobacteraceae bacterium]|nr:glucose-6-phosphate isomerase [Geobacteraceae bacterium]